MKIAVSPDFAIFCYMSSVERLVWMKFVAWLWKRVPLYKMECPDLFFFLGSFSIEWRLTTSTTLLSISHPEKPKFPALPGRDPSLQHPCSQWISSIWNEDCSFACVCNILQYVQCRKAGLDEICGMAVKTGAPLENGVSWPFFLGEASL